VKLVLDTSAIIHGFRADEGAEILIPERVIVEAEKLGANTGIIIAMGATPVKPDRESVRMAEKRADEYGEALKLSATDIEVIALAIQEKGTVVSDDYPIENLCAIIGIDFLPISYEGIKEIFVYTYQCTGCRRRFRKLYSGCPVCGSPLRTKRENARKNKRA